MRKKLELIFIEFKGRKVVFRTFNTIYYYY